MPNDVILWLITRKDYQYYTCRVSVSLDYNRTVPRLGQFLLFFFNRSFKVVYFFVPHAREKLMVGYYQRLLVSGQKLNAPNESV